MRSTSFGISFGMAAGALGLSLAGVALVLSDAPVAAVVALLLASVATVRIGVRIAGTSASLTVIFLVFHVVYGLSGPIAVLAGAALPDVFGTPYELEAFIAQYGLATFGFGAGLLLAAGLRVVRPGGPPAALRYEGGFRTGIIVLAMGSLFEIVNFVRAGGWPTVIQGKAVYQSAVDALVLTLPSSQMVSLGLVLSTLTLALAPRRGAWRVGWNGALLGFLAFSPALAITLVLGSRGPLLEWLLVVLVGAYYYTPLNRLSWRTIGLVTCLYLASGLVYANRAIIGWGLVTRDWEAVRELAFTQERLILAVNPAATEFGAAFGNFSTYVTGSSEHPRLGASYIRALTLPIPGFLYPGKKPQQISYEFRDKYFSALSARGAIAGTAYSSLLEAYVNFGFAGGALVYFSMALLLAVAERIRRNSSALGWHLGYILLVSSAVAFHRSDFSFLIGSLAMIAVLIIVYLVGWSGFAWLSSDPLPKPGALTASH